MVPGSLLEILVCPKCQGKVTLEECSIVCRTCMLKYPVTEDIPVMLIDSAEKIEDEKK